MGCDALVTTDLDPTDPALRRQVLVVSAGGWTRRLSSPEYDGHAGPLGDDVAEVAWVP